MGGTGIPVPPEQTTQDQPNQTSQAAQSTGQPEFVPGKGSRVGGILSTLLGWKHREEMQKREERVNFLQSTIHEALTNPNNLLPREYLDKYIGELSKNLESGNAPNIGKILKGHADQVYGARDLAKKAAQARSTTPIGQAPPVMPQQAAPSLPPPPGPAPGAAPDLESGGSPTPFEGEAPAGGAPPLQNENPAVKAGAAGGGAGFNAGMPPPAAVLTPPPVQIRSHMMTPAEKGAGQAARARPSIEMKAQVERQQMPLDLATRRAMYESMPGFKDLTERQQLSLLSGTNITAEPHFTMGGITMSVDGDLDKNGQPVPPGTPGKQAFFNGQAVFIPEPGRMQFKQVTNADGSVSMVPVNAYTGQTGTVNPNLTSQPKVRMVSVTHPDGTTSKVGVTSTGQVVSDDKRLQGINPSMLATDTDSFKLVPQADGSTALVPVTTQKRKVGRGLPAPPSAAAAPASPGVAAPNASSNPRVGAPITVGGKSLTPSQVINLDSKARVFDNTLDLAKSVKDKLGLLNNLIDAKKIDLQIDPNQGVVKAAVNRSVPMSSDEVALAGDFVSLMEHINSLRGPLAATGFRGHEAFSALQAQRGQLLAKPEVTKRVLENTIKALTGQRDAIRNGMTGRGKLPNWAGMESGDNFPAPPAGSKADPAGIR